MGFPEGRFDCQGVVATSLGGSRVCCTERGFCSRGKKRGDGCNGVKKRGDGCNRFCIGAGCVTVGETSGES